MKKSTDLGRDRVGPLLVRLALPAVLAQLVNALYNIVDRMYIGRIPGTGALALTGLGVCFPVIMLVSARSSASAAARARPSPWARAITARQSAF